MEVMDLPARERVLGDRYLLDTIFSYLDPPSVKTVRLVSRYDYLMIRARNKISNYFLFTDSGALSSRVQSSGPNGD